MGQTALVAAVIAATVSLLGIYLTSAFAERREWRKARWERELERLLTLEESAGCLVESVLAHGARDSTRVTNQLSDLYIAAGRFLRYRELAQAIRELHQAVGSYLADERSFGSAAEYEQARANIGELFQVLLAESDRAYLAARRTGVFSRTGANNSSWRRLAAARCWPSLKSLQSVRETKAGQARPASPDAALHRCAPCRTRRLGQSAKEGAGCSDPADAVCGASSRT